MADADTVAYAYINAAYANPEPIYRANTFTRTVMELEATSVC